LENSLGNIYEANVEINNSVNIKLVKAEGVHNTPPKKPSMKLEDIKSETKKGDWEPMTVERPAYKSPVKEEKEEQAEKNLVKESRNGDGFKQFKEWRNRRENKI
jgi:hypothetical protein